MSLNKIQPSLTDSVLKVSSQSQLAQEFRLCKARVVKRKFIQKKTREQLKNYKLKVLRFLRRVSSESEEDAQKRISNIEQQLSDCESEDLLINRWIEDVESRIKNCSTGQQTDEETLFGQVRNINKQIVERTSAYQVKVQQMADHIDQVCLESIKK